MPRKYTVNEILRKVSEVYVATIKSGGADDTLSGNEAASQTVLSLVSATGFTDLKRYALSGDGGIELIQQTGAPATNDITITTPTLFAQSAGATVKEVNYDRIGYIDPSGLQIGFQQNITPVEAANSETALVYIDSPIQITGGFNALSFNLLNVLASQGIVQSEAGDGAAYATAYRIGIGPASVKDSVIIFRGTGTLHDGQNFEVDWLGARLSSSGQIQINRQNAGTIPFSFSAPQSIIRMWG